MRKPRKIDYGPPERGGDTYKTAIQKIQQDIADILQEMHTSTPPALHSGKGNPNPKLGKNGDFYLDYQHLVLFGPKNSTWGNGQGLKGPKGDKGDDGDDGEDGKAGSRIIVSEQKGVTSRQKKQTRTQGVSSNEVDNTSLSINQPTPIDYRPLNQGGDTVRGAIEKLQGDSTHLYDVVDDLISSSTYIHEQATPSSTWTINHNLGRYPSVQVVDSAGDRIWSGVNYTSENQLVLEFGVAFSGVAHIG